MKLAVNILLSLVVLAVCVWLVWPNEQAQLHLLNALGWVMYKGGPNDAGAIEWVISPPLKFSTFWPYLLGYLALLATTHFCRAWRWNNLLSPIGVKLAPRRLLAVSSVGFMAILVLPARLGEFVRPTLIRKKGEVSASAALGTIAVERIVDGLLVSLFVFGAFVSLPKDGAPTWILPAAYGALGLFTSAMIFLAFALRKPEQTVSIAVRLTFAQYYAPRLARVLEEKLLSMISGFLVLKDRRNLAIFVLWSFGYWTANGMSVWLLAQGFGLDLSILGAFATMGLVAVGIMVPNAPALMGQYQFLVVAGLGLYLPAASVESSGLLFAIVLWGIQVIWYIGVGMFALSTKYVSFAELRRARNEQDDDDDETQSDGGTE